MCVFHCLEVNFLKTTIETLIFPSELKNKLSMKVGKSNLNISFINGHAITIDKTNLSITEPHKIIVNNNTNTLIAYVYDDVNKIYLPNHNAIISITKYISILNEMNKSL